jgi:cbb3-type cytochrome oxidase subunit 3
MTPTLISLLAVTFGFIGLVVWVYWPSRKQELESLGHIPLDDSEEQPADRRKNS